MAGNIPKRVLKQPEVDKCLLGGTRLWKFEEVHQFSILAIASVLVFMVIVAKVHVLLS